MCCSAPLSPTSLGREAQRVRAVAPRCFHTFSPWASLAYGYYSIWLVSHTEQRVSCMHVQQGMCMLQRPATPTRFISRFRGPMCVVCGLWCWPVPAGSGSQRRDRRCATTALQIDQRTWMELPPTILMQRKCKHYSSVPGQFLQLLESSPSSPTFSM